MKKVLFLFGELSDDDIDWLISTASKERIAPGTIIIQEGKPVDALYILLEGTLSVSVAAMGNKRIATLTSGEIVGEMSFIDSRPPSATVETIEECLVLAIPRSLLTEKLHQDVGFGAGFYKAIALFLSNRLRDVVSNLGYGQASQSNEDVSQPQLLPDTLDNATLAHARFDWLLRRLKGS